jgi:hypothetical protein
MRLRLMATYLGIPYQAGLGPDGTEATLFSPGPPPEEFGFTAPSTPGAGHWRKQVSVTDLGALWQSRPVGDYRGEPCLVLDDLGDRLHIAYLGRDTARAAQLGYWEIDREVFEVVVARSEVIDLTEERMEFPLTAAVFPPSVFPPSGFPPSVFPPSGFPPSVFPPSGFPPSGFPPSGVQAAPETDMARAADGPASTHPPARSAASAAVNPAVAEPAGYTGVNGHSGPARNTRPDEYHAAAVNGGLTGNGQTAGYGDADHASRRPDRMAAWHGSPEPWPRAPTPSASHTPSASPEDRTEAWAEDRSDPASEAGPAREPRPGARTEPWTEHKPGHQPWTEREPGSAPEPGGGGGAGGPARAAARRGGARPPGGGGPPPGRRDRISPESVFAELLALAAIPQAAYAVDEEVPGAMCLVEADGGFEVFSRTDDARLEVHFFEDEEAAYFYLFGVLAAEAVRSGRLGPNGSDRANGHHNGSAPRDASPASPENVSKYLRRRKNPNFVSHPDRVYLAGGADGPPLPKQPRRPSEALADIFILRITNRFHCL